VCPGFVRTPLVDKQIPEQAKALGISEEEVVRNMMLRETVDGEFTTTEDVAEATLFFAAAKTNALTGQSLIVSHGWFMGWRAGFATGQCSLQNRGKGRTTMPGTSLKAVNFTSALPRAIVGGFVGTIVFTLMTKFLAPMMIGHPMDIAAVIGTFTGLGTSAGMVMHFLLGSLGFAVGFLIVGPYLPGPVWLRGVTFMAGVWFFAGLVAMPILGVGLFFVGGKEGLASLLVRFVLGA